MTARVRTSISLTGLSINLTKTAYMEIPRSQDLLKGQLQRKVCSKELLMQDKMDVGTVAAVCLLRQQYVYAEMQTKPLKRTI